jgi:hypothetical protein
MERSATPLSPAARGHDRVEVAGVGDAATLHDQHARVGFGLLDLGLELVDPDSQLEALRVLALDDDARPAADVAAVGGHAHDAALDVRAAERAQPADNAALMGGALAARHGAHG